MESSPELDVVVYVVWSPQLGAEERHVPSAAALVTDERARHFWDPDMAVGSLYQDDLGLPEPAWDVWLLFGPEATWEEGHPEPAWWEHQLHGLPDSLRLDPQRFAARAQALASPRPNGRSPAE